MANETKTTRTKDMVIVGGGPAGLTAAIYAQRAMLDTVLLEQEAVGGQVISTSEIDNYPGVPHTDGFTLTDAMQQQAEDLGATIEMSIVEGIEHTGEGRFLVHTPEADYDSATVIVAGGATPRHAGFEGEEKYAGHGVSYCATCDGMFYRGKKVFVIGGGNSACEEALFLTRFADEVVLVVRKDHLRAQASVAKLVDENPKLTIRYLTSIVRVDGGQLLSSVTFRNNASDEETTETYPEGSFGVFVFVGRVPATELISDLVELDSRGYVVTNDRLETKTAGLYAAGDLRQKPLRQIITAAADGAIAVNSASAYLGQPVEG
nr:FAD-dependent oxidoreductase [Olegusella massiliensis]